MKRFRLLIVLFSLVSISAFSQTLYLSENFDYGVTPDTITLVTSNWVLHSGKQAPQYVYPGLSYASYDLSDSAGAIGFTHGSSGINDGDVHRVFSDSLAADGNVYVSFLLKLDSARTGDYFFHLGPRIIGTTFRGRVYAKAGTTGWLPGLAKSSEGATYGTTELNFDQTYLVVLKYSFSTATTSDDSVTLYIYDSGIPATEPGSPVETIGAVGAGTSGDPTDIGSVAIRQSSNCPTGTIDGIQATDYWPFAQTPMQPTIISIDSARGLVNDTVTISGVVISPNYQTSNRSYYIWDGTGGIDVFSSGLTSPDLNLGDSVVVTGKVTVFNGLTELGPLADTSIVVVGTNAVLPQPELITVGQYNADPEKYESHLIGFVGLSKASGTWSTTGSSTLKLYDAGHDTLTAYLDSDTKLFQETEPTWPVDVIAIGSQYSGGYEVLPRYITDFLPEGTLPVELTSFAAQVMQRAVVLNWETATEINNSGFNVERSTNGKTFQKVAFIRGKGTSSEISTYSFTDNNLAVGNYYYRLQQVDFDGTTKYSKVIEITVNAAPAKFDLYQNYPNPFNPSTTIKFSVEKTGIATLKIFNSLGQEVATLFNAQATTGQLYSINFNASNIASGIYFYQLRQGSQIQTQKMLLMK